MELLISAVVSLLVQAAKKIGETKEWATLLVLLIFSLIGAVVYTSLINAGLWESLYKILLTAAGIYAVIIRRFESKE